MSLLLSTYQKPRHLQLSLASVAGQQGVAGKLELIVTDDGSTDDTSAIVERFARSVDFPVAFTTHPHRSFQLARCRNEGVAVSKSPYLVFLDGDCILPKNFVLQHLAHRRPGVAMTGDCFRLDEETSVRIDERAVRDGNYLGCVSRTEKRRLRRADRKARLYNLLRTSLEAQVARRQCWRVWRCDFERVNGYDEDFEGWGCEDDDLGLRLRKTGLRIESIMRWTRAYHVWHPRDVTAPSRWREGANVERLLRGDRPVYAVRGLNKKALGDRLDAPADAGDAVTIPIRRPAERELNDSQQRKAA